jgi:hypothetical protein
MEDFEDDDKWVKLLMVAIVAVGAGTMIATMCLTYKVIKGVYHLLDKLIDKI